MIVCCLDFIDKKIFHLEKFLKQLVKFLTGNKEHIVSDNHKDTAAHAIFTVWGAFVNKISTTLLCFISICTI